ncbi:MAG: c-type cytochrome [Alphaproteobacteria bacterium]|nr:c-type cytochrome [Alphaproteobacteria bacterium]
MLSRSTLTALGVGGLVLLALAPLALVLLAAGPARAAETLLERGRYLVTTVAACGRCHTPRLAGGVPDPARELAGGFAIHDPAIGNIVGPNLTPDNETGLGKWSEQDIVTALRYGVRPDGTVVGPPMPVDTYRGMSDRDLAAIAKYLHNLKPVHNQVAKTQFNRAPLPHDPTVTHVETPPRQDKLAYGAYLAGPIGHCYGCHTVPRPDGAAERRFFYAGGRDLPDYADVTSRVVSRNITADPEDGIGKWSDAEIKRAIKEGVRPDGTRLAHTMPFDWYKKIMPADLDAIVAYLRTIKPIKTPNTGG